MGVSISLAGKNAIVTGGAGGMGRCTARMLAEAGANVLVSDMDGDAAAKAAAEIAKDFGVRAIANTCNVASKAEVDAMVAQAVEAFGQVDILKDRKSVV